MSQWLSDNVLTLMVVLAGAVGVYTALQTDLSVIQSTLESRSDAVQTVASMRKQLAHIEAEQEVTRRYWDRFETVINKNTDALMDVSAAVRVSNAKLMSHEKRLDHLEEAQ